MIDLHNHPVEWGIRPILFNIGNFAIPSYTFFVFLGLSVGILAYYYEARRRGSLDEKSFLIAFGSLAGGVLGAKILQAVIDFKPIISNLSDPAILMSGRTIVGGLIGGLIGSAITKRIIGIREKKGNLFAPAVAIGTAIGRLGCFFRGCCYGKATILPWGVDFGDGVTRHPAQLYESLFMLAMYLYLVRIKDRSGIKPGGLFQLLMVGYFIMRFLVEFVRVEPVVFSGLTIFQIISVCVIIYLMKDKISALISGQKEREVLAK